MEKIIPKPAYYWYAVYTKSRAEKKAQSELKEQNIEVFLPLQRKLRQWSDRKKWVDMPLIPGYLFVRISRREYDKVLQSSYVVTYVRFEGTAAIIPDEQIEYLKMMLKQDAHEVSVTSEQLQPGKKIEVIAGPMIGMKAVLVKIQGKNKVAIQIEQIGFAALVEIPVNDIRLI
jgi:transcription antitermination factor NusG